MFCRSIRLGRGTKTPQDGPDQLSPTSHLDTRNIPPRRDTDDQGRHFYTRWKITLSYTETTSRQQRLIQERLKRMTPIVFVQNVIHPCVAHVSQGNSIRKHRLHPGPPPTPPPPCTPLLNNKMQTVCNGWYYTLNTEPVRVKNTLFAALFLIETFIFDRKAEQY